MTDEDRSKIMAHTSRVKNKKNLFKEAARLVLRYQKAREETEKAQRKIVRKYRPFCLGWGKAFSGYLDGDVKAGESLHDETVLKALSGFRSQKGKPVWRHFNAYLVCCLLNRMKNLRYEMGCKCPVCGNNSVSTRQRVFTTGGDVVRVCGKVRKKGKKGKKR